jgi:hypothetical protein
VFELRVNLQSTEQIVKQDGRSAVRHLIDVIKRIINCVEDNSRVYSRLRSTKARSCHERIIYAPIY